MSMFSITITFISFLICIIYGDFISNMSNNNISIGPCLDGMCMEGYECKDDQCYQLPSTNTTTTITKNTPMNKTIGPCINGDCPNGFVCINDSCYSQ
uniref:CC domain-containing protein n=1 Tax=Strongyloides papillosus TaxID=174720 RepID=A0A0N5CA00_STREA